MIRRKCDHNLYGICQYSRCQYPSKTKDEIKQIENKKIMNIRKNSVYSNTNDKNRTWYYD